MLGHGIGHLRRDDGLHDILVAVQFAALGPAGQLVAQQQHEGLIAVQQHVFALLVAQRDADAVRIGVGGQHQVGALLRGEVDGHRHRLALLGVGGLDGGEVAVDDGLLLHQNHVREAELLQRSRNQPHARAVHRRIDDLHVVVLLHALGRKREFVHLIQIDLVELLVQNGDVFGILARKHHIDIRDLRHLGDDVLVVRLGHLRAVGPVGLVAIVLLGVVRGGDDHARMAFQLADGEAQFRGRPERVEQKNLESVRGENIGHALGEHPRIVAAVVRHGDAHPLAREVLFQVVGKPLRGSPHRVDVHAVGPYAHNAAQTARTEFEVLVEALHELFHIVVHQVFDLLFRRFVIVAVEPGLSFSENQLFQFVCHNSIGFTYNLHFGSPKKFICKYTN